MRAIPFFAAALALAPAAAMPDIAPAGGRQHAFGDYLITVSPDPEATAAGGDYQITVENSELLVTRLTAPYEGTLSHSFVADLDKDGDFEVVVTFSDDQGRETTIDLYAWNAYLLEPIKVAPLDAGQRQGYRGGDEFAVSDGKLLRIFQIYEQTDGEWLATAARRQLRYSLGDARWLAE